MNKKVAVPESRMTCFALSWESSQGPNNTLGRRVSTWGTI